MSIQFEDSAWEQFIYWQGEDKKTLKKINKLIADIQRNGNNGIGHPEPLKDNLSGLWSREIDEKNRLIYKIDGDCVRIYQCKNHYSDK
ncbi:MAG: Txe/YoeB family addiction module toxin [Treponema sp.]|uniref:Txe/YoeB family addiction module toxin n=1 Tax=Treponema sp. TaxID=166 RepID=UPI0025F2747C|nr:Txe/YoeB family addiction module toxin [Treponema sp.]MBQ9623562.1 Txe/YoeB family addiction module toxin [Treponema sp.]MBR0495809.1 Txe/YoeB family addiction module toxin [Treponema sp.]